MDLPVALFEEVTGSAPAPESDAQPAPPGAAGDRRTADRVFLSRRALVAPIHGPRAETPRAAMVRDLSLSGIGLLHDRKLKQGEEFVVYLPRRHGGKAVPVRCVTTHCESGSGKDGLFLIGARFVAVLDPEYAPAPAAPVPFPAPPVARDGEMEEARRIQQAMFTD